MKEVHPQSNQLDLKQKKSEKKRISLMVIPMKKFAAEQFDEKAVVLCQFCGGEGCKQQNHEANKKQPNAIIGLHSNWITPQIVAMQRPSERLIKEFNLYESFKNQKINTILNLQQPGQHPFCGDGIIPMVGFSYDPQGFFASGISFFNESWEDMTATTFQHMMRIMNIFHASIVEGKGKISVHCHAGRGRTLLVICSWLIYENRMSPKATIDLAIQKRQGVLTRSSQRQFLYDFEDQLKIRWKCFEQIQNETFSEYVQFQKSSLLKFEQVSTKYKPYLHYEIVKQLRGRFAKDPTLSRQIIKTLVNCSDEKDKWTPENEKQLTILKNLANQHLLFNKNRQIVQNSPLKILSELLYDFYDNLPFVVITSNGFQALNLHKKEKSMQAVFEPQFVHQTGVQGISVLLDFVYLLKSLVKGGLNLIKEDSEDSILCQCLFLRIAHTLSSKRKYSPKIFTPSSKERECRLMRYDCVKRQKYTSREEVALANFMRSLTKEIGEEPDEIDDLVLKVRKIDSNLHYFKQKHDSGQGFFKPSEVKQIYENSRI